MSSTAQTYHSYARSPRAPETAVPEVDVHLARWLGALSGEAGESHQHSTLLSLIE